MARMTGLVQGFTNSFMNELERKRAMQEEQLEKERQRAELQSMFSAIFPGQQMPSGSLTPQTFGSAVNIMGQRETQQGMNARNTANIQARLDKEAADKLLKEEEKRAKTTAKVKAIKTVYSKYIPQLGYDVYDEDTAELALKDIARLQQSESFKVNLNLQQQKEKEMINYRETVKPPEKPSYLPSNISNEIEKILARGHLVDVPESEFTEDRDFTKPEIVYRYITPESRTRWDAEKTELTNKALSGGTGALYPQQQPPARPNFMQQGFQIPGQIKPQGAGKLIGTYQGRKIYQLPDDSYTDETGNPVEVQ